MKKNLLCGIASLAACILTSCEGNDKTSGVGLPVFDLEAAIGSPKAFDISGIADNIEFIALDDRGGDGGIGRGSSIQESKNGFYLSNWINPIKFFDKTGKFVATKGSMGQGPDEYLDVIDMAVDYERDNLYVMAPRNAIIAYDAGGRMFARTDGGPSGGIAYFDDKLISLRTPDINVAARGSDGEYFSDSLVTIIDVFPSDLNHRSGVKGPDRGVNIVFSSFDENGRPRGATISLQIISDNGTDLIIKEGRCDTVFHYGNDNSLDAVYRLDAGKYTLPAGAYGTSPKVEVENHRSMQRVLAELQNSPDNVFVFHHEGRELYAPTQAFYRGIGYAEAARLADFYDVGDDKVIYQKNIATDCLLFEGMGTIDVNTGTVRKYL